MFDHELAEFHSLADHVLWALHHVVFQSLPLLFDGLGKLRFLSGVLFLLPHLSGVHQVTLQLVTGFLEFLDFHVFAESHLHAHNVFLFAFHVLSFLETLIDPVDSALDHADWAFHHVKFEAHHLRHHHAFQALLKLGVLLLLPFGHGFSNAFLGHLGDLLPVFAVLLLHFHAGLVIKSHHLFAHFKAHHVEVDSLAEHHVGAAFHVFAGVLPFLFQLFLHGGHFALIT